MAVPEERLQEIIRNKDAERAAAWCYNENYVESWRIRDGALIICDADNVPDWVPEDPEVVAGL